MSGFARRCAVALALCCAAHAFAAEPAAAKTVAEPYSAAEFPRWALDLRRGEAVAFGVLPFTLFFSTFAVDTYRCSQHDWDRSYAPWPFKSTGAVTMSENEFKTTFVAACVGAIVVAAVDFAIVSIKRHGKQKSVAGKPKAEFRIERGPSDSSVLPSADLPPPESP